MTTAPPADAPADRPTRVRYLVLGVTAAAAVFMYVDRVCIAQVKGDIQRDLGLSDGGMRWVVSAFFWSYALAQVPAGVLGLRVGHRRALAAYLFFWSFFTALCGVAAGFAALVGARAAVGLAEAGAYPTAAALVKSWFPLPRRGFANSMVALGGRLGGAFGQLLTPTLVVALTGVVAVGGEPVPGWRLTLVLFGAVGMCWAVVFLWAVRNSAGEHPQANRAEVVLIGPPPAAAAFSVPPLGFFVGSRSLWALSAVQFCFNFGWVFLITEFPNYLETVHGKVGAEKGFLSSVPGFVGCGGMFLGGFMADWSIRRLGLRSGRLAPVLVGTAGACVAYLICAGADSAEVVVAALCLMTVSVDLSVPAVWAIAQDIGGKRVGPVLGWANMWGNIGAAVSPLLLGLMLTEFGWTAVFGTLAAAFLLAGCAALLIDASKPIESATD